MRRALFAAFAGFVLLAACEREERETRSLPAEAERQATVTLSELHPGSEPPQVAQASAYEQNAYHLSQGKQLFKWYNCNGCHANGGGDIGPALMDAKWIYGSEPQNIYATIVEGRPNGMPSFRGKIPDYQVWELVAYVRSLSGQGPPAARSGREDALQAKPAEQQMEQITPKNSALPPSTVGTQ
jgi:cytochrome c oxidase cbb3-type subunit III